MFKKGIETRGKIFLKSLWQKLDLISLNTEPAKKNIVILIALGIFFFYQKVGIVGHFQEKIGLSLVRLSLLTMTNPNQLCDVL